MTDKAVAVEHANAVYAALAGGVLWGLARLYVAAFSPTPPRKRDLFAALVESTFALITAAIGGYYVAPALVAQFHIIRSDLAGLLSVGVGLGLWQSIPILRSILASALPNALAERLGIKTPVLEIAE